MMDESAKGGDMPKDGDEIEITGSKVHDGTYKLEKILAASKLDPYVIPADDGYKFEMISGAGPGGMDVTGAIKKLEEDMAREILDLPSPKWNAEKHPLEIVDEIVGAATHDAKKGQPVSVWVGGVDFARDESAFDTFVTGGVVSKPDACRYAEPQVVEILTCAKCGRNTPGEDLCARCNSPTKIEIASCGIPESAYPTAPDYGPMARDQMADERVRIVSRLQDKARARIARLCNWPFCGHTQRNVSIVWINDVAHWQCSTCAKEAVPVTRDDSIPQSMVDALKGDVSRVGMLTGEITRDTTGDLLARDEAVDLVKVGLSGDASLC